MILVVVPAIDLVAGLDRSNPPDDVIEALENDRYYRWITYLFLPIQYAGFVGAMYLVADPDGATCPPSTRSAWRSRSAASAASASTPPTSSATRRRPTSAGCPRSRWPRSPTATSTSSTTAATTSGSPPPRTRRSAVGRELLPVLAAHGPRLAEVRLADREASLRRKKQHPFRLGNDVLNAWLMTAVLWGAMVAWLGVGIAPYLVLQAVVGFSLLEVVNYMEHYGMLRQKVGVGERQRYERVDPVALVELQQHRHQRAALPPAAAQRPPRQPDPALPGAARLRGVAGAADRVRRDDRAGDRARRLAPGDGPAGGGATSAATSAGPTSARASGTRSSRSYAVRPGGAAAGCGPRGGRARPPRPTRCWRRAARAAPTPTTWSPATSTRASRPAPRGPTSPTRWCCPDCGVRDKADFVPVEPCAA